MIENLTAQPGIDKKLPDYESKQELAARLGVSTRSINALMERGLPYLRLTGKLLRFSRATVDRWLAEKEIRRA